MASEYKAKGFKRACCFSHKKDFSLVFLDKIFLSSNESGLKKPYFASFSLPAKAQIYSHFLDFCSRQELI